MGFMYASDCRIVFINDLDFSYTLLAWWAVALERSNLSERLNMMVPVRRLVTILFFLCFTSVTCAEVDETQQASQVVQDFQAELINVMQQGDKLSFEQRFKLLKPVVLKSHNLARITRIVVSKEWKKLTLEQKKRLVQEFSKLSISSYAHYFKSFSGESFKIISAEHVVKGEKVIPNQIYVHTLLILPKEKDVSMDYLLKKKGDNWRIINIISNGVSDLALKRSEYKAVLDKSGYDGLIAELSAKIKEFSK